MSEIGAVQNQGVNNAAAATYNGLLAQIGAFNNLSAAQSGVAGTNLASAQENFRQQNSNAQAIGSALTGLYNGVANRTSATPIGG